MDEAASAEEWSNDGLLFQVLPEELLVCVFSLLDYQELLSLSLVNSGWYRIMQEPTIWRNLVVRMKLDLPYDAETKNWKKRFLRTVIATFRGHPKVKDLPFPAGAATMVAWSANQFSILTGQTLTVLDHKHYRKHWGEAPKMKKQVFSDCQLFHHASDCHGDLILSWESQRVPKHVLMYFNGGIHQKVAAPHAHTNLRLHGSVIASFGNSAWVQSVGDIGVLDHNGNYQIWFDTTSHEGWFLLSATRRLLLYKGYNYTELKGAAAAGVTIFSHSADTYYFNLLGRAKEKLKDLLILNDKKNTLDTQVVWMNEYLFVLAGANLLAYDKQTGDKLDWIDISKRSGGNLSMARLGGPKGQHLVASSKTSLCCWRIPQTLQEAHHTKVTLEYEVTLPSAIVSFQVGHTQIVVLRREGDHHFIKSYLEVYDIKTGTLVRTLVDGDQAEFVVSYQLTEDSVLALLAPRKNRPLFLRVWKFY